MLTVSSNPDGSEFVFYIPGHRNADGVETIVLRPHEVADANPSTLCADDEGKLYGFTVLSIQPTLSQVVLCPLALDPSKSFRSIAGITSSTSPGNNGKATSNIGNYESTPGTFLHEIIHLLGSTYNEQYFARKVLPGTNLQCYGPLIIYQLANAMGTFKPLDGMPLKGTVQAPDPYMYFCMSSLWTFQKWRFLF
ncbi:hypothetical protein PRZ48_003647 [Zasmidium cellare]|uniref:Uncharacterized protein n=1 Tax=Zasmidium cellare TaxID=395010 RepID=A0ABR0EVN0_ZASCE|nr:hypothetical protein PRZ48_003647 [Zasmidium cellare]